MEKKKSVAPPLCVWAASTVCSKSVCGSEVLIFGVVVGSQWERLSGADSNAKE
jgi:hypothetical protein